MSQHRPFVNLDKASDLIEASDDPIEKVLLQMALMKVMMLSAKRFSRSGEDSHEIIFPEQLFDLFYYIRLVQELFEPNMRDRLKRILEGDSEAMKGEFEDL